MPPTTTMTIEDSPNPTPVALEFSLSAAGTAGEESPTPPTSPIQQGTNEMAPPPPRALMDDVISEILLRLPPEEPASLLRASLVCKSWHRLLSDGTFVRQYRTFHRTPPVLGYFQDLTSNGGRSSVPQFVPTIQSSPVPQPAITSAGSRTTFCNVIDCRHGRVLFQDEHLSSPRLTVWDPITGNKTSISPPVPPYTEFCAAVLCAADGGCDHLGCSGGPFLVVVAGIYEREEVDDGEDGDEDGHYVAWASLYSSETGVWSPSTSIHVKYGIEVILPTLLTRDAIYFLLENGERILRYGLVGGVLSLIKAPPQHGQPNMIFAMAQDGELGAATVEGYSLHQWSWRATNPNGDIGEWIRCRVIKLDVLIPLSIGDPTTIFELAGFVEGTGSVFISANDDLFIVELKSGRITKMGKRTSYNPIFPLVSFYAPDIFTTGLQSVNDD